MFGRLAHLMYRRRWYVLATWVVILVVAMTQAAQVGKILGPGDFVQKGSDSYKAAALLDRKFHQSDQKVTLVVVHSDHSSVAEAAFRGTVASTAQRITADSALHVSYIDNPVVSGNQQLISRDRHSVALLVSSSLKETKIEDQIAHLRSIVRSPGFTTYVTGTAAMNYDYSVTSKEDLSRGDAVTVPILIIILLLVFGTVVASALPLVLAGISITLSLALVYFFGHYIDTSVYVTNVVTVLGLGVGIDYSLFIVYRFREELEQRAGDVEGAVVHTMETTGRAVFFSGLTVAIGLSSLILTGISFMQSMGLGGILVPATALVVAMTLLPALLSVLGSKVNRLRVVPSRFLRTSEHGFWHRLATTIMRRPLVTGGAVLIALLALTYPVTKLNLAYGGLANAPRSVDSVAGIVYMQDHFPSAPNPTQVVIQAGGAGSMLQTRPIAALQSLENSIRREPEARRVIGLTDFVPANGKATAAQLRQVQGRYLSADGKTAIISVVPRHDAGTTGAETLVRHIRTIVSHTPLAGNTAYVGGSQASFTDFNDALYSKFPFIVALVLLLTYAFLFYAFRSIFLPLKAVLLNLLSVGASYGTLQLVFQHGVGSSVLGFTPESGVAGWVPIFLFAFLFGLSMDYEVFLLSRIQERWLVTQDNEDSVVFGLQKTGKLISSAAAIMVIAFSGFLVGHQIQLKEFGLGLMVSIALDATLIRLVLVPSIMQLMGDLNWWVPGFLRGFAANGVRFGEGDGLPSTDLEAEPISA